ncbi:complex I NDUFA9 subunit family protein, partial [Burkholderia territorii]
AHVALPAALAAACVEVGVRRVLHMSALGADSQGPSMYQRSKGDGEAALHAVAATDSLALTIFRPSVVFGPGDAFLNTFANLQRTLPVLPLAMPDAQFQPVFVGDVVRAFVNTLDLAAAHGKTYELGGPTVYTLEQLVRYCGTLVGRQARIVRLPDALAQLQARVFECLPGEPVITRDNLASMSVPNVLSGPLAPELGIAPASLESIAPAYLGHAARRSRFDWFRSRR